MVELGKGSTPRTSADYGGLCPGELHVHADADTGDDENLARLLGDGAMVNATASARIKGWAVRSLDAAQAAVRAHRQRCPGSQATVHLAGTFELRAPLRMGPEDSGTPTNPVTWRGAEGASPVLSGGVSISGWQ